MDNFYQEKAYFMPGKNQEKWLYPPWKIFFLRHCRGVQGQCRGGVQGAESLSRGQGAELPEADAL